MEKGALDGGEKGCRDVREEGWGRDRRRHRLGSGCKMETGPGRGLNGEMGTCVYVQIREEYVWEEGGRAGGWIGDGCGEEGRDRKMSGWVD